MTTTTNQKVAVRYIGRQPVKKDNVLNRGHVWNGVGAICQVDPKDADVYFRYADVWVPEHSPASDALASVSHTPAARVGDQLTKYRAIKKAVADLDRNNIEHYTKDGRPRIAAVRKLLPDMEIRLEEFDAALMIEDQPGG